MASTVPGSCRAWNCSVKPEAVRHLGDIEYLRSFLPVEAEVLKPEQLYWITDRTPHESLPLKERTYRQFFRIVTADVSFWYKDHSTPNPLGVKPDPKVTRIVTGDKFSEEGVEVVDKSLGEYADYESRDNDEPLTESEDSDSDNDDNSDENKDLDKDDDSDKNYDEFGDNDSDGDNGSEYMEEANLLFDW